MKISKNTENFLLCLIICIGIISLRLVADYPRELIFISQNIMEMFKVIIQALGISSYVQYLADLPDTLLLIAGAGGQLIIGLLFLFLFKRQSEQGAMVLIRHYGKVISSGLVLYFGIAAIVGMHIYSVVGIPFSIASSFIVMLLVQFGRISLAIFIGYVFEGVLRISGYTLIYYLIGNFIMILSESVFGIGGAFIFFVYPVLSLGTVFLLFVYRRVLKISLPVTFKTRHGEESFDRDKIRDIIKEGLDD